MTTINRFQFATIVAIVILAISLTFVYFTTSSEIANLQQNGKALCRDVQLYASDSLAPFFQNLTTSLQRQIQNDKLIISTLNSTRPPGYEGTITLINAQITQDNSILRSTTSVVLFKFLPSPADLCSTFQP